MKQKINSIDWMIATPLLTAIWLLGGFYTYSVLVIGCLLAVLLFVQLRKTKRSRCERSLNFYGVIFICIFALVSVFVAIDKGMAWYGFLRILVFVEWIYYLMQFRRAEREKALSLIPVSGALMVGIGLIGFVVPGLKEMFWQAERLGGIYQYSNTCALFFLIGIWILAQEKKVEKKELLIFDVLILGVFLTGSRGGILILLPMLIWIIVKKKEFCKNGLLVLGILLIGGLVYGLISGNFQNIARIFTVFSVPATLVERGLYMLDALPLVIQYPLGMGYMGYASVQPAIQTGIYTSMFVHNEWLQMFLDYGILFGGISIFLVGHQLIKGKQESWKKIGILIICLYSLLEFHFQYASILMILTLFCEFNEGKMVEQKKATVLENQIFTIGFAVVFGYFAIASFMSFSGNTEQALTMFPYDTQAMEAKLLTETDKNTAVQMAEDLLELNAYKTQAYNVLAYAALMDGEVERAIENKFRILEIERFNMEEYADFEGFVQAIILSSGENEDIIKLCEIAMIDMGNLLEETERNVNPMAYQLREVPVFTW